MRGLLGVLGLVDAPAPEAPVFTPPADATTVIGPGVALKGELRGVGPMVVLGTFEGELVLDGALHVGPDALVDANITAIAVVVAGTVRGNLSAGARVEILPTGSLTGSVRSGSFSAAGGASVKGEIWVERTATTTVEPC